MRALIINDEVRNNIAALKQYAAANVIKHDQLMRMANGLLPPPGDNPKFKIDIPQGFRVVFTNEENTGKMTRHISISVASRDQGKMPHTAAIEMICKEFGFTEGLQGKHVYLEEDVGAVDIIEIIPS